MVCKSCIGYTCVYNFAPLIVRNGSLDSSILAGRIVEKARFLEKFGQPLARANATLFRKMNSIINEHRGIKVGI